MHVSPVPQINKNVWNEEFSLLHSLEVCGKMKIFWACRPEPGSGWRLSMLFSLWGTRGGRAHSCTVWPVPQPSATCTPTFSTWKNSASCFYQGPGLYWALKHGCSLHCRRVRMANVEESLGSLQTYSSEPKPATSAIKSSQQLREA